MLLFRLLQHDIDLLKRTSEQLYLLAEVAHQEHLQRLADLEQGDPLEWRPLNVAKGPPPFLSRLYVAGMQPEEQWLGPGPRKMGIGWTRVGPDGTRVGSLRVLL